jgi:hypothetical protein
VLGGSIAGEVAVRLVAGGVVGQLVVRGEG